MKIITGASGGIGSYLMENLLDTIPFHHGGDFNQLIKDHNLSEITLINCAGINYSSFAHKASFGYWAGCVHINLIKTFEKICFILPLMREQKYGRIINLSSVVANRGVMGTSAYAASKAGLNGMIKSIAMENARFGITINNINLGYFNCGIIRDIPENLMPGLLKEIPMNRLGDPAEIVKCIEYIESAEYLTGACIDLDGGL